MSDEGGATPRDEGGGDAMAPGQATAVDGTLAGPLHSNRSAATPPAAGPEGDVLLGRTIAGRYEIRKRIGAGGMGVVYLAYQAAMDRQVALKVLSASLASDETSVRRFNQEARAASRLRHPNTITLHDFGKTDDDILFIAMELLVGTSLEDTVRKEKRLPLSRALRILCQVCRSLEEAHQAGVIHRDLKPDNIFLCELGGETDFVKVLDFGVAKLREAKQDSGTLTQAGMIFGTPRYMSPEQAQSLDLDARSDLYALGVILYEMLVGRAPFVADSPLSVLIQHVHEKPPPFPEALRATLPPSAERLVTELLEKDPALRPKSAKALLERMLDIAAELPGSGERPMAGGTSGLTDIRAFEAPPAGQSGPAAAPAAGTTALDARPSPLGDPGNKGDTWPDKRTPSEPWAFAVGDHRPALRSTRGGLSLPLIGGIAVAAVLVAGGIVMWGGRDRAAERPATPDAAAPATVAAAVQAAAADAPADAPAEAPAAGLAQAPAPPTKARPAAPHPRPAAPPKSRPETITITLGSVPAGAEVHWRGEFLGLTPLTLDRPKSAKAETFELRKSGYETAQALAVMSETRSIMKRLQKEGEGP